ncbi:hypothetical protein J3D57_000406 [Bacillus amyloliquefaciens]|nr:hypothetical protein [Bacillus amyloliquefaciens]
MQDAKSVNHSCYRKSYGCEGSKQTPGVNQREKQS